MIGLLLAAAIACPQFFADGARPAVSQVVVEELCFTGYATDYAPAWREPVYSAEELTAESVRAGEAVHRFGSFKAYGDAKPSDYDRAGYDRGHMVNADDRGADKAETFCMCNMVPQRPDLNRKVWLAQERRLRTLALGGLDLFVLSGPLMGADPPTLKGKELVPVATWKAVYAVGRGYFAILCTNDAAPVCKDESVADLRAQIGFDPFPQASAEDEATLAVLQ